MPVACHDGKACPQVGRGGCSRSSKMEGSCECTEQGVAEKRWPSSLGAALGANQRFTVNKNKLCCYVLTQDLGLEQFEENCARENGHVCRPRL